MNNKIKIYDLDKDFERLEDLKCEKPNVRPNIRQYRKRDTSEVYILSTQDNFTDSGVLRDPGFSEEYEIEQITKFWGENMFNLLTNGKHCSSSIIAGDKSGLLGCLSKKIEGFEERPKLRKAEFKNKKIKGLNTIIITSILMDSIDSYRRLSNIGFVKNGKDIELMRIDFDSSLSFKHFEDPFISWEYASVSPENWKSNVANRNYIKDFAEFIKKPPIDSEGEKDSALATTGFVLQADDPYERIKILKRLASIKPEEIINFCKPYESFVDEAFLKKYDISQEQLRDRYDNQPREDKFGIFIPGHVSNHINQRLTIIKNEILPNEPKITIPDDKILHEGRNTSNVRRR